MKRYYCSLIMAVCMLFLSMGLLFPCSTAAEELDIINRPVNTSGLSGLLFTTSPYTLPKGTFELSAAILNEISDVPKFTITEFPFSISVGLPNNSELALKSSYFNIKEPPSSSGTSNYTEKTGNVELSYKWNFMPQPEDSMRPAFALIVSGMMPTNSNHDFVMNAVQNWGIRAGLSMGTEINWQNYILCVYADVQAQAQDLTKKNERDFFGIFNAGIIFPISKYRNLQMFLEYSQVFGREQVTLEGGDYYGGTFGIRLVSERFNFTMGSQFLYKQVRGYDNSSRLIGLVSMKL